MFIAGIFFIRLIHIILAFHSIFADTVDHDMCMDVAGVIAAICVSNDYCLIAGKVLLANSRQSSWALFPVSPHSDTSTGSKLMM